MAGFRVGLIAALVLALPALAAAQLTPAPATPAAQAIPQLPGGWSASAVSLRGQPGTQAAVNCPAHGRPGGVWGIGVYTDDSSVCTAAVHAGRITLSGGGLVVIETRAGLPSYPGVAQNGVTSAGWGAWQGSFIVLGASPQPASAPSAPPPLTWSDDTRVLGGAARMTIVCPPGGSAGTVWGSGIYTDDSSLCTAAVHAGVIGFAAGGKVTIERRPGQSSYPATVSNGVHSQKWGAWTGSFVVVGGTVQAAMQVVGPATIDWSETATELRDRVGQRIRLVCAPGGSLGSVWGSGVYTDDSSICSAAVHAGLITERSGGPVTLRPVSGRSSYQGTTAHGVTTSSYGAWQGSFELR